MLVLMLRKAEELIAGTDEASPECVVTRDEHGIQMKAAACHMRVYYELVLNEDIKITRRNKLARKFKQEVGAAIWVPAPPASTEG